MRNFRSIPLLFLVALCSVFELFGQTSENVAQVSITVSDLDQALRFYTEVLPFKKVSAYKLDRKVTKSLFNTKEAAQIAVLRLGDEQIELIAFENSNERAIPADAKSNDLWFQHIAIVVSDMENAYQHLRKAKVQHVSTSPQTLPAYLPAAAGISAFYFQDPDGHNLEIIHFPQGKGNEKWQNIQGAIFLGIDHTAIGIDDTDKSTLFYEQLAGLKVAGNSENYGSEQEHLNQMFGAHLLITGLKAMSGFGVEFLDYLAPPGGRNYPSDSKASDLWHWHTTIFVTDVSKTFQQFVSEGKVIVSKVITDWSHPTLGKVKAFVARDPDGHALMIVQKM